MQDLLENKGTTLYRGTGLTQKELQKYIDLVGKTEMRKKRNMKTRKIEEKELPALMALTGFISTSMTRSLA